MSRHILSPCFAWAVLVCLPLMARAQCDPGPATGSGISRCYDDGYVYLDITGNGLGYTWNWGYQSASQIQDGLIVFHSHIKVDANTEQDLTDTYDLGGIIAPGAPYAGSFQQVGPVIPDEPVSRSTMLITLPLLSTQRTAAKGIVVAWPSPSTGWRLQQNGDLNTTNWTDVLIEPDDDGINKSVPISPMAGSQFYRLKLR